MLMLLKKTVAAPFRVGATATILNEKMVSNADVPFLVLSAVLIVELRPWSSLPMWSSARWCRRQRLSSRNCHFCNLGYKRTPCSPSSMTDSRQRRPPSFAWMAVSNADHDAVHDDQ